MTKTELISLVKSMLDVDRSPNVYKRPLYRSAVIERFIGASYEQMYNELYNQNKGNVWEYVKTYSTLLEGYTPIEGIALTPKPIILSRPGSGLFKVGVGATASIDDAIEVVLTDYQGWRNDVDTAFDTIGIITSYLGAYFDGKVYWKDDTTVAPGSYLITQMIPQFASMGSDDEVLIPMGATDHLIDRVIMTVKQSPSISFINPNTVQ